MRKIHMTSVADLYSTTAPWNTIPSFGMMMTRKSSAEKTDKKPKIWFIVSLTSQRTRVVAVVHGASLKSGLISWKNQTTT